MADLDETLRGAHRDVDGEAARLPWYTRTGRTPLPADRFPPFG